MRMELNSYIHPYYNRKWMKIVGSYKSFRNKNEEINDSSIFEGLDLQKDLIKARNSSSLDTEIQELKEEKSV